MITQYSDENDFTVLGNSMGTGLEYVGGIISNTYTYNDTKNGNYRRGIWRQRRCGRGVSRLWKKGATRRLQWRRGGVSRPRGRGRPTRRQRRVLRILWHKRHRKNRSSRLSRCVSGSWVGVELHRQEILCETDAIQDAIQDDRGAWCAHSVHGSTARQGAWLSSARCRTIICNVT